MCIIYIYIYIYDYTVLHLCIIIYMMYNYIYNVRLSYLTKCFIVTFKCSVHKLAFLIYFSHNISKHSFKHIINLTYKKCINIDISFKFIDDYIIKVFISVSFDNN